MMMRTGLVFVLLLCLCSHSSGQGCRRKLLENVDFPRDNIAVVYSPDVHHCQQMCTQNPQCLFFTFIRADWTVDNNNYVCVLKKSSSGNPDEQKPLVGVTSGYSLKPCRPISAPCFDQVYNDTDFFGADYEYIFTADYKECQRFCTYDSKCQSFTWLNGKFSDNPTIRNKCHLKTSRTVPAPTNVNQLNGVISGFSSNTTICAGLDCLGACTWLFFPSFDPWRDFIVIPTASRQHCQTLCSAHPMCTTFDFLYPLCSLVNDQNGSGTSGLPSRFCQQDKSLHCATFSNIDFYGDDMTFVLLDDAVSCQKACNDNPNCLFYTYITSSFSDPALRKHCFLKRVITIPAPPNVSNLANAISGFTLRNCAGQPSGVCSDDTAFSPNTLLLPLE